MRTENAKAIYWRRQIEDFRSSGLSQTAYCRKHHIKSHSLSYWLGRTGSTPAAPSRFVAVQIDDKAAPVVALPLGVALGVRVVMPDGVAIECASRGDLAAVGVLVGMLRGRAP